MIGVCTIRPMAVSDAASVAELATQLGYPSTPAEIADRFADLAGRADYELFAADDEGRVVGWAHVELKRSIVADRSAQVMALVVAEDARSRGVGGALVRSCEEWAARQGVRRMVVASRVTRQQARRFYEREGYAVVKTSNIFEKHLA